MGTVADNSAKLVPLAKSSASFRPIHPAWLRCDSVTGQKPAPSPQPRQAGASTEIWPNFWRAALVDLSTLHFTPCENERQFPVRDRLPPTWRWYEARLYGNSAAAKLSPPEP